MRTSQSLAPRLSNVGASSLRHSPGDGRPQVIDAAGRNVTPRALQPLQRSTAAMVRPPNLAASNLSLMSDGSTVNDGAIDVDVGVWEREAEPADATDDDVAAPRYGVAASNPAEPPRGTTVIVREIDTARVARGGTESQAAAVLVRTEPQPQQRKRQLDVSTRATQVLAPSVRTRQVQARPPASRVVATQVAQYEITDAMRAERTAVEPRPARDRDQALVKAVLAAALHAPGCLIDAEATVRMAPLSQPSTVASALRGSGRSGRRRVGASDALGEGGGGGGRSTSLGGHRRGEPPSAAVGVEGSPTAASRMRKASLVALSVTALQDAGQAAGRRRASCASAADSGSVAASVGRSDARAPTTAGAAPPGAASGDGGRASKDIAAPPAPPDTRPATVVAAARRILTSNHLREHLALAERVALARVQDDSGGAAARRRFAGPAGWQSRERQRALPSAPTCAGGAAAAAVAPLGSDSQGGAVVTVAAGVTLLASSPSPRGVVEGAKSCGAAAPAVSTPTLAHLWRFGANNDRRHYGHRGGVTSMAWNNAERDIVAIAYSHGDVVGRLPRSSAATRGGTGGGGAILLWSARSPGAPVGELRIPDGVGATSVAFSHVHPALLAAGLTNGVICIFDVRTAVVSAHIAAPIALSERLLPGAHTEAVSQLAWTRKPESGNEVLVSVSTDGRVTEWVLKSGGSLVPTPLMTLRRPRGGTESGVSAAACEHRGSTVLGASGSEGLLSRVAGGLCLAFSPVDATQYVVGTLDGDVLRCSTTYTETALAALQGAHVGGINRVAMSPFHPHVLLTASSDWTAHVRDLSAPAAQRPLVLCSANVRDGVLDAAWSPTVPTLLAAVTGDGHVLLWDVEHASAPLVELRVRADADEWEAALAEAAHRVDEGRSAEKQACINDAVGIAGGGDDDDDDDDGNDGRRSGSHTDSDASFGVASPASQASPLRRPMRPDPSSGSPVGARVTSTQQAAPGVTAAASPLDRYPASSSSLPNVAATPSCEAASPLAAPQSQPPPRRLTSALFSPSGGALIIGDVEGRVDVYALAGMDARLAAHEHAAHVMAALCRTAQGAAAAPAAGALTAHDPCGALPAATAGVLIAAAAGEVDSARYRQRVAGLLAAVADLSRTAAPTNSASGGAAAAAADRGEVA